MFLIYFEKRKDITNESSLADGQFLHGKGKPILQYTTKNSHKHKDFKKYGFCLSCKKVIIVEELMTVGAHSWYNRKD